MCALANPAGLFPALESHFGAGDAAVQVWGPAVASEDPAMLLDWVRAVNQAGFGPLLILNGKSACKARLELTQKIEQAGLDAVVLSLPVASIGEAQQLAMQRFLQDPSLSYLVRLDPDMQFPVSCISQLLAPFATASPPDVVVGFRDEAGSGGFSRFLGNVALRLIAQRCGITADPNSGAYALSKKAAALLQSVPLPRFPEPRMLREFRGAGLKVATRIVPTLPRFSGKSSIRGSLKGLSVFCGSVLDLVPCEPR